MLNWLNPNSAHLLIFFVIGILKSLNYKYKINSKTGDIVKFANALKPQNEYQENE